ncbi:hypothetical protein TSAR_009604 [Trichomalopsis sarcophagae]|uniref:Uncharacterized protein n=1 Tax=Trichomalopsis sarcophagae TaxID=543379 RepID=A0A232ENK5_9HYME|nr:hypothetical protein TSAR_009604 [Trichomalopsis sarcophagae]
MNRYVFATFLVFTILFQNYYCAEDVEPQVKIKRVETNFVNPIYVNPLSFELNITKENATYNNLGLHWEVKRDLPTNLRLISTIFTTDANGRNSQLIMIDNTPVCVENNRRQLLPKIIVVDSSKLGGRCIKKGIYETPDMGQLRFEHLIKDLASKRKHYKVIYTFGSPFVPIMITTFYSEWGYLNN